MGFFDKLFNWAERKFSNDDSDAENAFKKIYAFMTDESLQNASYPSDLQQKMISGGDIDVITGATGDFGRSLDNPIPVNGPLGELTYISNLILQNGVKVIGHRLGSIQRVDIYETVALDGSKWDILLFDMYHTRKSRLLPKGYSASLTPEPFLFATNFTIQNFPGEIHEAIQDCTEHFIGIKLLSPQLRNGNFLSTLSRTDEHLNKIQALHLDSKIGITDEDKVKSCMVRGADCIQRGDYKEALNAYTLALEIEQENAYIWFNIGTVKYHLSDFASAETAFLVSVKLNSDLVQTWNSLGVVRNQMENFYGAIECFDKAIALDASSKKAWLNRSSALFMLGKRDEAIQSIKKALEIDPKYEMALNALEQYSNVQESFLSQQNAASIHAPYSFSHFKLGDVILSNYLIEDIINTGGMGIIYVTTHTGWKVKVAIKSPTEEMLKYKDLYYRITKEADAWINLGLHPNITYCYFIRAIEEVPYLFVEYVDGGNLREWIETGKCNDLKVVLDLAIQFCFGMAYAHSTGLIHRDIKPDNILITKDGLLKITDFGIALVGSDETSILSFADSTKTIGFIGTKYYASPEQLNNAHNVHEETDIFSFGVCLWEMLLGRRPYLVAVEKLTLPDPLSLNSDIPQELASILTNLVAFDETDRKALGGFGTLVERFKDIYNNLFHEESPHSILETLNLKADGLNNRGVSFWELGEEKKATCYWEQALKEDPQHLEATFNYGYYRWWCEGAPYQEVLRVPMSNLKDVHESRHDYWRLLAWLYYEQGEIDALDKLQNSAHGVADPEFLKRCYNLNNTTVRCWHFFKDSDSAGAIDFSPDGRYIVSCSLDGTVRLWDIETGKELRRFNGHSDCVSSVALSPDGRYIVSCSLDGTVRLWEIETSKELRRFNGHSDYVSSVTFSPDGRYILSGSDDSTVRLWETATGKEIRRFDGHSKRVRSVVFSPDGRYVLSGSHDKTVRLWEVTTGKELRRFEGHNKSVVSVAFSPDGRYIISGSGAFEDRGIKDNNVRLWEVATGKELRHFEEHSISINSVTFSPDGRYILSSGGKIIRLWDVATGKELKRFEGTLNGGSVAFSPDGRYILSVGGDRILKLCSWESLKMLPDVGIYPVLSRIRPPSELITDSRKVHFLLASATACIEKGSLIGAYMLLRQIQIVNGYERDKNILDLVTFCGLNGRGIRRDLKDGWHDATFEWSNNLESSVAAPPDGKYILSDYNDFFRSSETPAIFSPDGRYVLSGSHDKTARLWEVTTGKELRRFEGHNKSVTSVAFSPDGEYTLSGSLDSTVRLWEVVTGKELRRFEGHSKPVVSVAFSPDGSYVLSGSEDKTLRLWEMAIGKELKCFEGHSYGVNSVAFSPDGSYVLSGSGDRTVRLWEAATGKEIKRFEGHCRSVTSVAFSPDGRYALSGSGAFADKAIKDNNIRLWDITTGKEIRRFEGHSEGVSSVTFSRDGRYVLSGSKDKTIRLWEAASGKEIKCFEGQRRFVTSVTFSPDGRYILSGSEDNTIWFWELDWEWEFPEEGG